MHRFKILRVLKFKSRYINALKVVEVGRVIFKAVRQNLLEFLFF